jgi:hypothetical protein
VLDRGKVKKVKKLKKEKIKVKAVKNVFDAAIRKRQKQLDDRRAKQ